MKRSAAIALMVGTWLGATSCTGVGPGRDTVEHVDSGGVVISTSLEPRWDDGHGWSLSPEPSVIIGGPEPDQQIWRVSGFVRTEGGDLAVLSAGHREVRVFDSLGTPVVSFGRQGQGPGELTLLPPTGSIALAPPDTVLVLDSNAVEEFLIDGTFVRSHTVSRMPNALGPGSSARPAAVLPDRSLIALGSRGGDYPTTGVFRPDQAMALISPLGTAPRLLAWYPGAEQERLVIADRSTIVMAPFFRHTTWARGTGGDVAVWVADTELYEIHGFDSSGTLRRIVRRQYEPVPVDPSWVDDWKRAQGAAPWIGGPPEFRNRILDDMQVRATLPPIDGVTVDSEGYVWVLRGSAYEPAHVEYDVFDPDGALLGTVLAPAGLRHNPAVQPLIGPDDLVGLWIDALGVETIRVYELDRTEAAR